MGGGEERVGDGEEEVGEGAGKEEEERNEHWPLCMTLRYDVDKDKLFLGVSSCWVPLLKVPALITR